MSPKLSKRQNPTFVVADSVLVSGGALAYKERIAIVLTRLLGWDWRDVALAASVFRVKTLPNGNKYRMTRTSRAAIHSYRKFLDDNSISRDTLTFDTFLNHRGSDAWVSRVRTPAMALKDIEGL